MMRKAFLLFLLTVVSLVAVEKVESLEGGPDCDPGYMYCFDWENAEYSEVDGAYCDAWACAYPPGDLTCWLGGVFGDWCAVPLDDYSECDSEPLTCTAAHIWSIPPPPCDDGPCDDGGDGEPTPTPYPPPSAHCPTPSIVQEEIRVTGELVDPPYPVVIGQDLDKRGADIRWRVEIPPVIHTWYEEKVIDAERVCHYVGEGNGSGCPGPGSQYDRVIGSEVGWKDWMASSDAWDVEGDLPKIECIEHVDIYTEQLTWVQPTASLSPESRNWILTDLAARYPGARVYQPEWSWFPPLLGMVLADRTYIWEWTEQQVQFRDPGEYGMAVKGGTTGTLVTAPRVFDMDAGWFTVWLYEATLKQ
jgi:hypothetical protein